ncbi:MAG: hypothetical protein ABEJ07_06225 [Candidatus Nanohaloarchaea archaeon]
MMRAKFKCFRTPVVLAVFLLLASSAHAYQVSEQVTGASEPSEGTQDFWFEAEKFTLNIDGELPPTDEKVVIEANTSYGRTWKIVKEVEFTEVLRTWKDGSVREANYYELRIFDPNASGEFRVNAKAYLDGDSATARAGDDDDDSGDWVTDTAYASASLRWAVVNDSYANYTKQKECDICGVKRSGIAYNTTGATWYTMRKQFDLASDEALMVFGRGEKREAHANNIDDDYAYATSSADLQRFLAAQKVGKGQLYLNVNGTAYTGRAKANDRRTNLTLFGTTNWTDTNKTINLDIDETRHMVIEGKYYADSPASRTPEHYRWKNKADNFTLVTYGGFDSGSGNYHTRRSTLYPRRNDMPSGTYELQVKSTASSYPVKFEQTNFTVHKDSFVANGNSITFAPEFTLGANKVSVFPPMFHFNYTASWTECHKPDYSSASSNSSMKPADGANVMTRTPKLNVTNYCKSIDTVTFRDGNSDTVIARFEDVKYGEQLVTETSVSLGDTYRWYVRFCDQGVCYDTELREFVVGESDNDVGIVTEDDLSSQGEGLRGVVRDEDFHPLGTDSKPGDVSPLSEGYVNKLEEQSDQLEPGMGLDTYGMPDISDRNTVSIWSNSNGSWKAADQWSISPYRNWSISNRGKPYPPWDAYYRDAGSERISTDSKTVSKTSKIFANSLAVVAQKDITEDGDFVAQKGAGVWIDPDMIGPESSFTQKYVPSDQNWYQLLDFDNDLTGPDSGLGYDEGDGADTDIIAPSPDPGGELDDPARGVVKADILFQGEGS